MIVRVLELEMKLNGDLQTANHEIDRITRQESVLSDAASDTSIGSSRSLDSLRDYIAQVRRPATTLLRDYLCSYVHDMHVDQQRIALHVIPLGHMINTDLVQGIIDERHRMANRIDELAEASWVDPTVAQGLRYQAAGLRNDAGWLQGLLSGLMWYLGDDTIYAATASMWQRLQQSRRALNSVKISTVNGERFFNLTDVDLTWAPVQDKTYWKKRNQISLERYLILDGNGNPIGLRLEMLGRYTELLSLACRCLFSSGMPKEIDKLTDDEKYVVLWLLSTYGQDILKLESALMSGANQLSKRASGKGITQWGIEAFDWAENTPLAIVLGPLVTGGLSFTSDGEKFYSIDSTYSVQRRNGFADVTELGGPFLGMDLDTTVTTFVYDGREYRLQTWDGTYGSGSAFGGEIGLYCRDLPDGKKSNYSFMSAEDIRGNIDTLSREQVSSIFTTYNAVPDEDQPDMDVTVHTSGGREINNSVDNTYWSFNAADVPLDANGLPDPGYRKQDTSVEGRLDFSKNPGLMEAMEEALRNEDPAKGIKVSRDPSNQYILHVEWKK